MVIDESGLVAAMKESWKGYGYKVGALDTEPPRMLIEGDGFCVLVKMASVPRKVLGLIAEHLGKLPEPGEAFQLRKKQEAQTVIFNVASEAARMHFAASERSPEVARTKLTLDGFEVWQRLDSNECRLLRPELIQAMANFKGRVHATGDGMTVVGEVSEIWIITTPTMDTDVQRGLKHLSEMEWVE